MSQWIVDASLTLGWYFKDEQDRVYNLDVLAALSANDAVVPFLWTYEVANGLVMAQPPQAGDAVRAGRDLGELKSASNHR